MKLREFQRHMARNVMRPLTPSQKTKPFDEKGRSMKKIASAFVKPNDRLTSLERLQIYNQQYWFRVLSCFYDDFPGLRAIMGDRRFEKMAEAYLHSNPSRSFTMRNLGKRLESWLKKNPSWIQPRQQLALDMVRLEWAHTETFDGGAEPVLTTDDLLDLGAKKLKLKLQPYIQLLALSYPVDDLLLEIKDGSAGNTVASNAVTTSHHGNRSLHPQRLKSEPVFMAIHRLDYSVYYKRLVPEAFAFLQALQKGNSLIRAGEVAFIKSKIPIENRIPLVQQWFEDWSMLGWFCKPIQKQNNNKLKKR